MRASNMITGTKAELIDHLSHTGYKLVKGITHNRGEWNEGFNWELHKPCGEIVVVDFVMKGDRTNWQRNYDFCVELVSRERKAARNTREGSARRAGRPAVAAPCRLVPLSVRVPQWLLDELTEMDGNRGDLVRDALVEHFGLKAPQ